MDHAGTIRCFDTVRQLVAMRTALTNRMRAILAKHGVTREQSDLFGKAGREFLTTVALRAAPRRRLLSLLSLIDAFDREITTTTKEIDEKAEVDERVALLCQIRGVGR